MATALTYLDTLARETHKSETEIMALAFRVGLHQLWRERTLGHYLCGEITRSEAVERVGIDWVELAERQQAMAMEDLAWGLGE